MNPSKSIDLHFDAAGTGRPLVLVHGWCCCRRHMAGLLEEFSASHRVFNVDLPGHGESPHLECEPTFSAYARALSEFLVQQDLKDAVLVGHSMGGVLSVLAAEISDRVAGVVNLDGAIPSTASAREGYHRLHPRIDEMGYRAVIEPFLQQAFFLPSEKGAVMESIMSDMLAMPEDFARGLLAQFPTLDGSAALRACSVPLLYIGSSHPRFDEAAVTAIRPGTHLARVVQSGHFVQAFALPQIAAMIRQFLRLAVE